MTKTVSEKTTALLQRRVDKLRESAMLRFPDDVDQRDSYIQEHLRLSERHDETHYWISLEAFDRLSREIISKHGPRPPLPADTLDSEQGADRSASRLSRVGNVLRGAARAARSVAKTSLGIDRASDEQVEARLGVCRACPGHHATFKQNGDLNTCGPMVKSIADAGLKTCGCVLNKKARDLKEDCPFGYWPKPDSSLTTASASPQGIDQGTGSPSPRDARHREAVPFVAKPPTAPNGAD